MNALLIFPSEIDAAGRAVLERARARRAYELHEVRAGLTISACVRDTGRGSAIVEEASPERVVLKVTIDRELLPRPPLELLIAVPRPQTVKKVLLDATTLGATRIDFVRTERVVKSYLQSVSLRPEGIDAEIVKGLEQANDSHGPEVRIHERFRELVAGSLPERIAAMHELPALFVAHTAAESRPLPVSIGRSAPIMVAVGPESGWTRGELSSLLALGFAPVSLGPRMLRVETAVVAMLCRTSALRG